MSEATARPEFAGPAEGPEAPFPLRLSGPVIKGFGRGSKELGIPTANIPIGGLSIAGHAELESGVYFGYAALPVAADAASSALERGASPTVFPMVMSLGYNPVYKNTKRSVEAHILHPFARDFYGTPMRLLMLGFVRPELDYSSLEALVTDINIDIEVSRRSLQRPAWAALAQSEWLRAPITEAEWEAAAKEGEAEKSR